jgi:MtN3 and saliva related transmembrane protein
MWWSESKVQNGVKAGLDAGFGVARRNNIGNIFFQWHSDEMKASVLGYVAGILTTLAFLPQVLKAFRTRRTKDISLTMWLMLCIGVCCWLVYGILLSAIPIIIANAATLILAGAVLLLKLRHG